jgi:hypothetical protein
MYLKRVECQYFFFAPAYHWIITYLFANQFLAQEFPSFELVTNFFDIPGLAATTRGSTTYTSTKWYLKKSMISIQYPASFSHQVFLQIT